MCFFFSGFTGEVHTHTVSLWSYWFILDLESIIRFVAKQKYTSEFNLSEHRSHLIDQRSPEMLTVVNGCLCPSQIHRCKSQPQRDVLRRRGLWNVLGWWGWSPHDGISALVRRQESWHCSLSLHRVQVQKKSATCKPGSGSHQNGMCQHLDLGHPSL